MGDLRSVMEIVQVIFETNDHKHEVHKMHDDVVAFCRSNREKTFDESHKLELYYGIRNFLTGHLEKIPLRYEHGTHKVMTFYNDEWRIFKAKKKTLCAVFMYFEISWLCRMVLQKTPEIFRLHNLCFGMWKRLVFDKLVEIILNRTTDVIMTNSYGKNESLAMEEFRSACFELCSVVDVTNLPKHFDYPGIYLDQVRKPLLAKIKARYESLAIQTLKDVSPNQYFEEILGWYGCKTNAPIGLKGRDIESAMDLGVTAAHTPLLLDVCACFLKKTATSLSENVLKLVLVSSESRDIIKNYLVQSIVENGRLEIFRSNVSNTPKEYVKCFVKYLLTTSVGVMRVEILREVFIALSGDDREVSSAAELLSSLCDRGLRWRIDVSVFLSLVISLLNDCVDRREFLRFYTQKFVCRQLDYRNQDLHAETKVLLRLNELYDSNALCSLKTMLKDLQTSKTESLQFSTYLETRQLKGNVKVEIKVLNSCIWRFPRSDFVIPAELRIYGGEFEKYYYAAHSGRKLAWVHNVSKGIVAVTLASKNTFNVQLALPQLAILLLFQNTDKLSLREMEEKLAMQSDVLDSSLCGLLGNGILQEDSTDAANTVENRHINLNMSYKALRDEVLIPYCNIAARNKTALAAGNPEEDLNFVCQAAIVRFAKERRKCVEHELIAAVQKSLMNRNTATNALVMANVRTLVEKEYLSLEGIVYSYVP